MPFPAGDAVSRRAMPFHGGRCRFMAGIFASDGPRTRSVPLCFGTGMLRSHPDAFLGPTPRSAAMTEYKRAQSVISLRTCLILSCPSRCPTAPPSSKIPNRSLRVSTNPVGAHRAVDRAGTRLGMINSTPCSLRIDKTQNGLTPTCVKDGFKTAMASQKPTFGNIVAGGAVGFIGDAASGANDTWQVPECLRDGFLGDCRHTDA